MVDVEAVKVLLDDPGLPPFLMTSPTAVATFAVLAPLLNVPWAKYVYVPVEKLPGMPTLTLQPLLPSRQFPAAYRRRPPASFPWRKLL